MNGEVRESLPTQPAVLQRRLSGGAAEVAGQVMVGRIDYVDIVHLHGFEYQGRAHTEWALAEGIAALRELKREGRIGSVARASCLRFVHI